MVHHPPQCRHQRPTICWVIAKRQFCFGCCGADRLDEVAKADHRWSSGGRAQDQGEQDVLALMQCSAGRRAERSILWCVAGLEQSGGVTVYVEAVAQPPGEPSVEFGLMAPHDAEQVRIMLLAGERVLKQVTCRSPPFDKCLRISAWFRARRGAAHWSAPGLTALIATCRFNKVSVPASVWIVVWAPGVRSISHRKVPSERALLGGGF
jgi:hypothetical protein